MNKKILSAGLVLAMLTSTTGVFAQETEAENEIMLISEEAVATEIENKSTITKELVEVSEEGIGIEEDTLVFDNSGNKIAKEEIKEKSQVLTFKDASEKLIAVVLIKEDSPAAADLDLYTVSDTFGELVNAKFDLALHIAEETVIVDLEGNEVAKEDLAGKNLLVFYTQVAMSLPGQTTPEKIIVIGEGEAEEEVVEEEKVYEKEYQVKAEDIRKDEETVTLPLRAVSEGLGLEVGWDDGLKKITVGTVPMGVNFVLGVNEYNKSRMMPFTLEKAPELVIFGDFGVTYVPVSFFTDVLDADVVENEDGTLTVKR